MSMTIIRHIVQTAELVAAEQLQREVWGMDDLDIVPAAQLRAAAHAGGHVIGAYRGAELIGFAYAMVALAHGRGMSGTGLHSHMVAVNANERGAGIGRSLKWFQRRLALEQGLSWITWTFDPLQARNAKLNLEHLGAVSHDYLVDFYGSMPGPLGGGQASDRLLALWLLDSPRVRRLAEAQEEKKPTDDRVAPTADLESWLLGPEDVVRYRTAGHDALREAVVRATRAFIAQYEPHAISPHALTPNASTPNALTPNAIGLNAIGLETRPAIAKVAAPDNATSLLVTDPELASLWRCGMRAAMTEGLTAGLVVAGFQGGAYTLLSQRETQSALSNL